MSISKPFDLEDIDEAEQCIHQRIRLTRVRQFLLEQNADEDLVAAIDLALEDNEQWAIKEVEDAIQSGLLKTGSG